MNAERGLHQDAQQRLAVRPIGDAGREARHLAEHLGPRQHPRAQAEAARLPANGIGAQQQAREVELELVAVIRRVGALDVTELALVAGVDHAPGFCRRELPDVPLVPLDGFEQLGERRAQVEAKPAAVADVEDPLQFLLERAGVPIDGHIRVVGKTRAGRSFNDGHC